MWPRLRPELSCVCCRSRRRLGRLRARPASHCNLDRVVFRCCRSGRPILIAQRASTCSESCLSGLFPGARTDQDDPQWVKCGRQRRPWTDFAPSPANPVGPLPLPIEASKAVLRWVCNTSTLAVRSAQEAGEDRRLGAQIVSNVMRGGFSRQRAGPRWRPASLV